MRKQILTIAWGALCALAGVHCGQGESPGAAADGGSPTASSPNVDGGSAVNSVVGRYGFDVRYAVVDTTQAHDQCGWQEVLPDGSYAAVAVILADQQLVGYCGPVDGGMPSLAGHSFVNIQLAGPTYATQGPGLPDGATPAPLSPGQYAIANEGVDDDQICSVRGTGGSALVDVRDWGDGGGAAESVATAVSGAVIVTSVGSGYVAGTFAVVAAPPLASGELDSANSTPLSGTFSAKTCPGVLQ
jgi:hypothetical protein